MWHSSIVQYVPKEQQRPLPSLLFVFSSMVYKFQPIEIAGFDALRHSTFRVEFCRTGVSLTQFICIISYSFVLYIINSNLKIIITREVTEMKQVSGE